MNLLIISQLAKQADVNLETIRFYQRKGLIAAPEKPQGGIRRYGEKDVARVRFAHDQGGRRESERTAEISFCGAERKGEGYRYRNNDRQSLNKIILDFVLDAL